MRQPYRLVYHLYHLSRPMTKPTMWLCAQRRLRSACEETWVLNYPLSAQRRLWSDWAAAQADLRLRWAHIHFVGFVTRLLIFSMNFFKMNLLLSGCQPHAHRRRYRCSNKERQSCKAYTWRLHNSITLWSRKTMKGSPGSVTIKDRIPLEEWKNAKTRQVDT